MSFRGLWGVVGTVRDRPALLGFGLVIGLADGASLALLGIGVDLFGAGEWTGAGVGVLGRLGLLAVVSALTPGLYAVVRGETNGGRSVLAKTAAEARRSGASLFRASVSAHAVALLLFVPLAVVTTSIALGIDAVVQIARGTAGRGSWMGPWSITVGAWLVAAYLARLTLSFHDLAMLDGDERPSWAWLASARSTLSNPRALLTYGVGRASLLAAPSLLAIAFASGVDVLTGDSLGVLALAAGFLAGSCVARPALAAYHLSADDEWVRRGRTPAESGSLVPRARTAVAGMVLVATVVAGVGAVRVGDVDPVDRTPAAPDVERDDPSTVVAAANERTAATSHRRASVYSTYNDTTQSWETFGEEDFRIDTRRQRIAVSVYEHYPDWRYEIYLEDGRTLKPRGRSRHTVSETFRIQRQDGAVMIGPTSSFLPDASRYPSPALPWRVVNRTEDAVVYAVTDSEALHGNAGYPYEYPSPRDEAITYRDGNYVRVTVDRETGRLRTVEIQSHYEQTDEDETYVVGNRYVSRFDGYGTTRVERPAELDGPSVYATFWDYVDY